MRLVLKCADFSKELETLLSSNKLILFMFNMNISFILYEFYCRFRYKQNTSSLALLQEALRIETTFEKVTYFQIIKNNNYKTYYCAQYVPFSNISNTFYAGDKHRTKCITFIAIQLSIFFKSILRDQIHLNSNCNINL